MLRKVSHWTSWIWLIGLLTILSLHFWFPNLARRPMNDTYSVERTGKKAFFLLTERRFSDCSRNDRSPGGVVAHLNSYRGDVFCLLGPSRYPDSREWDLLLDWVRDGGSLIVAPRHGEPNLKLERVALEVEPLEDVGLDFEKLMEQAKKQEQLEKTPVNTTLFGGGELRWRSFGKVVGEGGEVLVEHGGEPQAVKKSFGAGQVLLIASDDIFSNGSLAYKDNGVLAQRLLESMAAPGSSVEFDEYFNTIGAPKVVGLLFDPMLRPLSVQGAALLLVFVWCGSRRFGRQAPRFFSSRHNIADHTDALGNMYYRTGDGQTAVRRYYEQMRQDLQLRYVKAGDARAIETLARRAGKEPQEVRELLTDIELALNGPPPRRREAAEIIRRMAELRAAFHKRAAGA